MSKITKEIVYEDIIECAHCGFRRQVKSGGYNHKWNFDRKCEVCKEEGCLNCMMRFEESDTYFYHKEKCSDVLPGDVTNRPYFGSKHVMSKDDIILGDKYIFHRENGNSKIIIASHWEHIEHHGYVFHYETENGKKCMVWPPSIGITSEAANFVKWGKSWLEKLED